MTVTPTKTDRLDELHRRLSAHVLGLISGADWQAMLNWYRSVFEASEWVTGSWAVTRARS